MTGPAVNSPWIARDHQFMGGHNASSWRGMGADALIDLLGDQFQATPNPPSEDHGSPVPRPKTATAPTLIEDRRCREVLSHRGRAAIAWVCPWVRYWPGRSPSE